MTEFDAVKHVANVDYLPGHPLHLSVDFNSKPYMTGLVSQMIQGSGVERIQVGRMD